MCVRVYVGGRTLKPLASGKDVKARNINGPRLPQDYSVIFKVVKLCPKLDKHLQRVLIYKRAKLTIIINP